MGNRSGLRDTWGKRCAKSEMSVMVTMDWIHGRSGGWVEVKDYGYQDTWGLLCLGYKAYLILMCCVGSVLNGEVSQTRLGFRQERALF